MGTWDGIAVKTNSGWIDITSYYYRDYQFSITFHEDGTYYGTGYFGTGNGTYTIDYKDLQIECTVEATPDSVEKHLKNVAEITADRNALNLSDRDSTPGSMDPLTYPNSEKNPDGSFQDDYDVEVLAPAKFDLALQKFITPVFLICKLEKILFS